MSFMGEKMKYFNLYPIISAQTFPSNTGKNEFFLFNSSTNRGFSLDGIAAHICKKFDGEKKLSEIIQEVELEHKLESGIFNDQIIALLSDMEKNKLISFSETAQKS